MGDCRLMKTAKDVCEAIQLKDQELKDSKIKFIIDSVEASFGTYKIKEYLINQTHLGFGVFVRSPYLNPDYEYVDTILDKEKSRLEELGFKIKESYEDIEYVTHESIYQDIPDFKLFGVVLKKRYSKCIGSENVLKKETVNVITISACCGE